MANWMLEMQDATLINAISAAMPFGALSLPALDVTASGDDTVELLIEDGVVNGGMFVINWGDGSPETVTSDTTPSHLYDDPGEYDITVRNWVGQSDTVTHDTEA